jgi:transcriptional regulator of acetoin/glycerol metabolism
MATNATGPAPSAAAPARGHAPARPIAASLALGPTHDGVIEQSHERCTALGLSRIERPDYAPLGRPDLVVARDRNRRLHSHAAPVMEMLADQIGGTESMVVLCDSAGTIIHSIGDDDFLSRASKVALQPGVNWSEQAKGTNAIGTALVVESATLVHADEHFMHANHFLTCSAAPILDSRGHILGVLDVTGDHRSYHQHTMALVKMSARMIENHWLSDDHRNAMRLHFHARPEFIDTLMEGILAVAPDGRIVGANRSALEQLGLSGAALRQHHLLSLFGVQMGTLVDRFRSPLATPLGVQTATGLHFQIHARINWSAWGSVAAPATAVEPVPAQPLTATPVENRPALAAWLTADPQVAALVAKLQRVLDRGVTITLLGDTGTGKNWLAQALHRASARAAQALVVQHCAGLSGQAGVDWAERLAQARGGTLLLDEVGQLPAAQQAQLLQALDAHREGPGDVTLVCTSTRALQAAGLRAELAHRLGGLTVTLPALRERSDLPALAHRMLAELAAAGPADNHADNPAESHAATLSSEALALLQAHPWPGNLRELHHLLRTAALLAGAGQAIGPEHLPDDLQRRNPAAAAQAPHGQSLQALELQALRAAVDAAGGNIALAARQLGVGRNTIYRKLRWGAGTAGTAGR